MIINGDQILMLLRMQFPSLRFIVSRRENRQYIS
jgi:hypothetical protein